MMQRRAGKVRADELVVARGLAESRARAQALILAGDVRSGDLPIRKPAELLLPDAPLDLRAVPPFVSRGGLKLQHALDAFGIDVHGRVAADLGASTGGFTDCLLQRGAMRVYAIDVGYGQLDHRLRSDERVVVMERVNARNLESLPEPVTIISADLSFISLRLVLPAMRRLLQPGGDLVTLVKPQFEAGRELVSKGGVVRDPRVRRAVTAAVLADALAVGLHARGVVASPLIGPAGNHEFLAWFQAGDAVMAAEDAERMLASEPSGKDALAQFGELLHDVAWE